MDTVVQVKRGILLGTCALVIALADARAQTNVPATASPAISTIITNGLPLEQITISGVADVGFLKCAFLQVEESGQAPRHLYLREGEQRAGIQVVSIDAQASRVTLRHRGVLREITLRGAGAREPSERDKDVSHARHHAARARLDREEDQRRPE